MVRLLLLFMVWFLWLLQAMQDFAHLCQEKDAKIVLSVLPLWPKLYAKLSIVSYIGFVFTDAAQIFVWYYWLHMVSVICCASATLLLSEQCCSTYLDVHFVYVSEITTATTTVLRLSGFRLEQPDEPVPEEAFTHSHFSWSSIIPSASSICYDSWHLPCSIYVPGSVFAQSLQVFFRLPLGLVPSTSYSIHFVTNYCLVLNHMPIPLQPATYSTEIMSSNPSLSLSPLLGTLSFSLMLHIHLTILISTHWSATSFSFLVGQVSLPCNVVLHTQLLCNLPLIINDISLLVSNGTNCLNLFHRVQILVYPAALASPSTPNMLPKWRNVSTNCRFALMPISTVVHPVPVTGFMQSLQTNDFITFTFLCIQLWQLVHSIEFITNASTTYTTWPSYDLLRYLLLFSTNHNLGLIHIHSDAMYS